MTKLRITPFLIVNPVVIAWMAFLLIRIMNRDGMAAVMSGVFITIILASGLLLLVDRMTVRKVSLWAIYIIEILLILISIKLVDWYVYG